MQKKSGIIAGILFLSLMFLGFVSAQFYGSFSIGDLLNNIDESTIVLGAMFIIVFGFVNFALGKFFRGNKAVSGGIAFAMALLVIYGINRSGFNYTGLFYNIAFFLPTGLVETIWPILVIGGLIFAIIRTGSITKGIGDFLLFLGALLMFLSFIGVFYELGGGLGFGFLIFVVGLGIRFWYRIRFGWRRRPHNPEIPDEHWSRWD